MLAEGPVVDKAVLRVLGDLNDIVNGITQHDAELLAIRGEMRFLKSLPTPAALS
jgi:hypothetical protein